MTIEREWVAHAISFPRSHDGEVGERGSAGTGGRPQPLRLCDEQPTELARSRRPRSGRSGRGYWYLHSRHSWSLRCSRGSSNRSHGRSALPSFVRVPERGWVLCAICGERLLLHCRAGTDPQTYVHLSTASCQQPPCAVTIEQCSGTGRVGKRCATQISLPFGILLRRRTAGPLLQVLLLGAPHEDSEAT